MQIKLRQDAVEVTVHDSVKDGGHTREEWPWKLLYDNQGPGDKWCALNSKSGWVMYKFKKPLLIRAYGLKSGNDAPVRDPKKFSFTVMDVLDERPSGRFPEKCDKLGRGYSPSDCNDASQGRACSQLASSWQAEPLFAA